MSHETTLFGATVSKAVGWEPRQVDWPEPEEVEASKDDPIQLLTWYRFLLYPRNDHQRAILDTIIDYWNNYNPVNHAKWRS
jgi:hypothetical protein